MVVTIDDNRAAGHAHVHTDRIEASLAMMAMGLRDHDVASCDPVGEVFELGDVFEHRVSDGFGDRDVVERYVGFGLHSGLRSSGFQDREDATSLHASHMTLSACPLAGQPGRKRGIFRGQSPPDTLGRRPLPGQAGRGWPPGVGPGPGRDQRTERLRTGS